MFQKQTKLTVINFLFSFFKIKLSKNHTQIFNLFLISTLSILAIIAGVILITLRQNIIILKTSYSNLNQCSTSLGLNETCTIKFNILNQIKGPIFFYYTLENYIQNHKNYILSVSYKQLYGNQLTISQAQKFCPSYCHNFQMNSKISWSGYSLQQKDVASPCGLQAKNLFNDNFHIYKNNNQLKLRTSQLINKYKASSNSQKTQWINVNEDKFQIWMNTGVGIQVQKLYGIIQNGLQTGSYQIKIKNSIDYGKNIIKGIKIMKQLNQYGQNKLLGNMLMIGGCLLFILSCLYAWMEYKFQ